MRLALGCRRATAALVLVVALAAAGAPASPADAGRVAAAPTSPQPNVLVIVTDDQRIDQLVGMRRTLEYFASGGTVFPRGYAQTPLCCPSRASILTGRFTHNHGVVGNSAAQIAALDHSTTLPSYLDDAGYNTGVAGKLFNAWNAAIAPPGFDHWALSNGGYVDASFNVDGATVSAPYATDFVGQQAIRMLDEFEQDDDRPWFLYLAPFAPHFPYAPAAEDVGVAVGAPWRNPARLETDRSDKPIWVQWRGPADLDRLDDVWRNQVRTLLSVDRMIGSVVDRLAALGEDDVLAVFVSDNGYLLGENGVGEDKRMPYSLAIRVPYMVRWPGHVAAGASDTRLALNADIAPTILEAAGVTPSATAPLDGRSLLSTPPRTAMFLEQPFAKEQFAVDPGVPAWASIRTNAFQYVEWYGATGSIVFREMYDLVADPWQLTNTLLGVDPNRADVVWLSAFLAHHRACRGTVGRAACL